MTTLYLFDLDDTLTDRNSAEIRPDVKAWLDSERGKDNRYAICTNQGGVGLRYWMATGGFGTPTDYPTESEIERRLALVVENLGVPCKVYVAFAYQSKKSGKWGPIPDDRRADPRWYESWRKPNVGMLQWAIRDAEEECGKMPEHILFVGNGAEDMQAAEAQGIDFASADGFFSSYDIPF